MAGNSGFGDDPLLPPGCYSQLLFGDNEISGLEADGSCFGFTSSFSSDDMNAPKMLCFGDYAKESCDVKVEVENNAKKLTGQKSGLFACTDASTNNTKISSSPNSINKKRNGSGIQNPDVCGGAPVGSQRNSKKPKSGNSTTVGGHAKVVKKEKLGERITALQQLVSPFGKTDTASVLHEALGYIRFLHDQVQVLCSPYLQRWSPSSEAHHCPVQLEHGGSKESERKKDDLRRRGLCLVPTELTLHAVADSNGADLWSSAAMVDSSSSS